MTRIPSSLSVGADTQFGAEVQALIVMHWCRGLSPAQMIAVLDHLSWALRQTDAVQAEIALPVPVAGSGAGEPVSPCEGSHTLRAGWRRLVGGLRWIEEMWIGDLIGVVGLALLFVGTFWLASAFSLPTGAEQLIQEVR